MRERREGGRGDGKGIECETEGGWREGGKRVSDGDEGVR